MRERSGVAHDRAVMPMRFGFADTLSGQLHFRACGAGPDIVLLPWAPVSGRMYEHVVPHLARFLVGPSFAVLLPVAAVLGGGYLLLIDTLARTLAPVEIPLGILTAVIGTPVFIALLRQAHRSWS